MKSSWRLSHRLFFLFVFLFIFSSSTFAETPNPDPMDQAYAGMRRVTIVGPSSVKLGSKAILNLPTDYVYIPPKEAAIFMRELGNHINDGYFYGLVFHQDLSGFISINYDDSGYIEDDDAKDWDADELLITLRKGTKESNKDRIKKGITPIEVLGWIEKPIYDASSHRLLWSVALQDIGSKTPADEQSVNYNTYLLGRRGYFTLNLVTDRSNVEKGKSLAKALLNSVHFNTGERYSDYNVKTDKLAEYGLAALVGGIAAKKIGLLAMIGIALLKFWKLTTIGIIAVGAGMKKFLFRDKS